MILRKSLVTMDKKSQKVPVIMYHSVGVVNKKWHWNDLTCPFEIFENQLKWLKKTGYETLNFQEIFDYIMNDKQIPQKSVFLTFDDGYLDNYIFVYPLLRKYGFKGTIFVNPDFVDNSKGFRKNLDDIGSVQEIEALDNLGFCNWDELRKMDKEGILDVQSHAKTHNWYPISEKIIDFRHPEDNYIWMDWNEYPEDKSNLQCVNREKIKLGSAVFENEKSLSSKRVFINHNFQNKLQLFVRKNGGKLFFENKDWRGTIENYATELRNNEPVVIKKETDNEYFERIKYELEFSKNEIEKRLQKEVKFLCWPGGSATKEGVEIADQLGYLMSTAARDIPVLRKKIKNTADVKINRISRFTPIMYNNSFRNKKNAKVQYSPGWFFILQLLQFKNKYFAGIWVKAIRKVIIKYSLYA